MDTLKNDPLYQQLASSACGLTLEHLRAFLNVEAATIKTVEYLPPSNDGESWHNAWFDHLGHRFMVSSPTRSEDGTTELAKEFEWRIHWLGTATLEGMGEKLESLRDLAEQIEQAYAELDSTTQTHPAPTQSVP